MSSRKRRRSASRKQKLRTRLLIYACLLVLPAGLGTACGAVQHLMPRRKTFGQNQQVETTTQDSTPSIKQGCLTGGITGGLLGAAACAAYTWASRQKKRRR